MSQSETSQSTETTPEPSSPSDLTHIRLFGLQPRAVGAVRNIERDGDSEDLNELGVEDLDFAVDLTEANVVTSRADTDGLHYPVLDLDLPARLIPSSTRGHGHLYIDKLLTWDKYQKLLEALAEAGIVESGYVGASIARGHTAVRLPWVQKVAPLLVDDTEEAPF